MSKEDPKYIATRAFMFSRDGNHFEVIQGEECPPLGDGRLVKMLQLGWVVPAEEYQAHPAPVEPEDDEVEDKEHVDWKNNPIADLDVETRIHDVLAKAGITTVGALLAYGAEHGTLTKIDGIGEASEKSLQEAIVKLTK